MVAAQTGGLVYAFTEATFEGKLVLTALFVASIFSWSVMVTKIRVVRLAEAQNDRFTARDLISIPNARLGARLCRIYDALSVNDVAMECIFQEGRAIRRGSIQSSGVAFVASKKRLARRSVLVARSESIGKVEIL